jgi:hypothetical protein
MSHTSLPGPSDATALLANLPRPIIIPAGFDVASQCSDAIADWDQRTRYRPFFQTNTTPLAVPYDPPGIDNQTLTVGGQQLLRLKNGLLSITSLYINYDPTQSGSGDLLTQNIDYYLQPGEAPTIQPFPEPYTDIKFNTIQRGLPQSVLITGVWGYCQGIVPDDAWLGILDLQCANICNAFSEGLRNGYVTIKDDDTSISRDPKLILQLGMGFRAQGDRRLFRYRLLNW